MNDTRSKSERITDYLTHLDTSIARGIADADAGRIKSARAVFDRLEEKYIAFAKARNL